MTSDVTSLAASYALSPVIRGLVQLVPKGLGGAVDTIIMAAHDKLQERRLRILFDRLAAGDVPLDVEVIRSEPFLHCYFATVQAVVRTHREQKIHLLANLLLSVASGGVTDVDAYDEYVKILDELSYREIVLLALLDKYERTSHRPPGSEHIQFTATFWANFLNEAILLLSIEDVEVMAMLTRLNGSGCYATYIGAYGGSDQGRLTALWHRIRDLSRMPDVVAV